ncbi:enoyl-CoA hydratase-related protein [Mesorhizobium australicum]|uniref:enoyl-CoA hydratase-related protein n=1 Tax=Mesorhizobium australicum TaxID=536018 RepID=UPI003334CC18
MFETVAYEIQNGTAEIRLNRPHRLNALVQKLYDDVVAALDEAERDKTVRVRVIVLPGEGRAVCVGAFEGAQGGSHGFR